MLLDDARTRVGRASSAIRCPPPGTTLPARSPTALRASLPRLGHRRPPAFGQDVPPLARGLQRSAAGSDPLYSELGQNLALSRSTRHSPPAGICNAVRRHSDASSTTRSATSASPAPTAGRAEARFQELQEEGLRSPPSFREPARRHQRPRRKSSPTRAISPACRPMSSKSPAPARRRLASRVALHAARAFLWPGDAICR